MPSALSTGPLFKFLRIGRKLTVQDSAIVSFVPRAAPASGAVGDMYMATGGVLKVCTVAGTPGTWVSVGAQT